MSSVFPSVPGTLLGTAVRPIRTQRRVDWTLGDSGWAWPIPSQAQPSEKTPCHYTYYPITQNHINSISNDTVKRSTLIVYRVDTRMAMKPPVAMVFNIPSKGGWNLWRRIGSGASLEISMMSVSCIVSLSPLFFFSLLLTGSICGTFNVQEQGIEPWKEKRCMNAKKKNKKPDRGGLSSIYLTTTATIIWKI